MKTMRHCLTLSILSLCVGPALRAQAKSGTDDPQMQSFVRKLNMRVSMHPYFKQVKMHPPEFRSPFVFYIQNSKRGKLEDVRKVINQYQPFLSKVEKLFVRDLAGPLKLKKRKIATGIAIAVLSSRESYEDYARAVQAHSLLNSRAHYNPRLQLCVTYVDLTQRGDEERRAVMHEVVHALTHAYNPTGMMPKPVWFNEGLAEFRSTGGSLLSALDRPLLRQVHLMNLVGVLQEPTRNCLMASIEELVCANSYADVLRNVAPRVIRVPARKRPKRGEAMSVFYAQASAFVDFLHQGEGGRHRAAFQRYAEAAMHGESGLSTFTEAFGKDTASLQQAFFEYVAAESRRRFQVGVLLPRIAGAAGSKGGVKPAAAVAKRLPPPPPVDASAIAWRAADTPLRVQVAEAHCVAGRFDAAARILRGIEDGPAQRMRQRAEAILALRVELLAANLKGKKRMAPLVQGKRVGGKLVKVEPEHFTLKTSKGEVRLSMDRLDAKNLENELRKQKMLKSTGWQRAWLRWLGGQSKARAGRGFQPLRPLAKTLWKDVPKAAIKEMPAAGRVMDDLARIQSFQPKTPAEARAQLVELRKIALARRTAPLFRDRIDGLRAVTAALAAHAFSPTDAESIGIRGQLKRLPDGRSEVLYDGAKSALPSDLVGQPDLMPWMTRGMPKLVGARPERKQEDTYTSIRGSGLHLLPVDFVGPQSLIVELELRGPGFYELLMATQPDGSGLRVTVGGLAIVVDRKSKAANSIEGGVELNSGKKYTMRLDHDGQSVNYSIDGRKVLTVPSVGTLTGGRLGVFVHSSSSMRIYRMKVVGKIQLRDAKAARDAYAKRLAGELW